MEKVFLVGQLIYLVSVALVESHDPADRLPTSITPLSYALRLEPDIDSNSLSGSVMIKFSTTDNKSEDLSSVTLHLGEDATINEYTVQLLEATGLQITVGAIEYDDPHNLVKVILPDQASLQYNQMYFINLHFKSALYSEPKGLFTGTLNATSKYIASNFRPTFARNVFPCFDEPQFKTPVTLQVLRPQNYSAYSTASLDSSVAKGEMVLDTFKATDPISIHSLGLIISELQPVESMGVQLFAPIGSPESVPFLQALLDNIKNTVGPFPITPLKLVVLPDQTKMHLASFGFVFTSNDIYTYNEKEPNFATHVWENLRLQLAEAFLLQYLEFAKTPEWWSHLWLSEGIGAFLASHLQPEVIPRLQVETRSKVLGTDIYSSRPVVEPSLSSHWEIEQIVASQYIRNKGFSVLTMWNQTLWEGAVLKTITDYISIKKTVVSTNDWLEVLVHNINANRTYDVTPAIAGLALWLNTSDYPLVTYQFFDKSFLLSQHPENSSTESVWPLSVSFAQNSSKDWYHYRWGLWLLNTSSTFYPARFEGNKWAIFNLESALYRVDYNNSWEDVQNALKTDLMPTNTPDSIKAAIEDDVVALSLQGVLPFSTAFNVLSVTQRYELDWIPVLKAFEAFSNKIGLDNEMFYGFRMFAESLFSKDLLAALDMRNKPINSRLQYIRALMTPWLCTFDIGNCRQVAKELFDQILNGVYHNIDPGDEENVACYGAQYNNSIMDHLVSTYSTTKDPHLRHLYTTALGCLSDKLSVSSLLTTILGSSSPFAMSDAKRIATSLAKNIANSDTVIDFVYHQASGIQSVLGSGCLGDILLALGKMRIDLSKVQLLVNDKSLDSYVIKSAQRAIIRANNNQAWWSINAADLQTDLLDKRTTKSHKTTTTEMTTSTSSESTESSSVSSTLTSPTTKSTVTTTILSTSTSPATTTPTTTTPATTSPTTTTPATTTPATTSPATTSPATTSPIPTSTTNFTGVPTEPITSTTAEVTTSATATTSITTEGTTATTAILPTHQTTSATSGSAKHQSSITFILVLLSFVAVTVSNS